MRAYQSGTLAILLQLCVFGLAASPRLRRTSDITPLSIFEDTESPTLNLTLANLQNKPLPPEPYIYNVPNTRISVKFQAFGHPIPISNVLHCLLVAANDVNKHFASPQASLGRETLHCSSASVRLVLYPAKVPNPITWEKWGAAIRGITDFLTDYQFVDLDFYISDEDVGGAVIAGGLISNR